MESEFKRKIKKEKAGRERRKPALASAPTVPAVCDRRASVAFSLTAAVIFKN
jgi:hypothetical protein